MSLQQESLYTVHEGEGPVLATALHAGHQLRDEVAALIALDEAARLREEDPYTDRWTDLAAMRIVPQRSRFEIDLNRPREEAFYVRPEDAWGLHLWRQPPSPELIARSLAEYDAFYAALESLLREMERRYGRFVVLDLHAYNHRRNGPAAPAADPDTHPEVNIGTGTMERERWGPVVERFIDDLREFDFLGRRLDVRENVKFYGRGLAAWVHRTFPLTGCVLAVEFKKFFMDEWTGTVFEAEFEAIHAALRGTLPGLVDSLQHC